MASKSIKSGFFLGLSSSDNNNDAANYTTGKTICLIRKAGFPPQQQKHKKRRYCLCSIQSRILIPPLSRPQGSCMSACLHVCIPPSIGANQRRDNPSHSKPSPGRHHLVQNHHPALRLHLVYRTSRPYSKSMLSSPSSSTPIPESY